MKKFCLSFIAFVLICTLAIAQESQVKINKGSRNTRTHVVTLHLACYDAVKMQLSNFEDFRDANWIGFQPKVYGWSLISEEGEQSVYARFKKRDGSSVGPVSAKILLDKTPPENCTIKIDPKKSNINDSIHVLHIDFTFDDPKQTRYMMVSNTRSFFRKRWQIIVDSIPDWEMDDLSDGTKMVYCKFRDKAGNISEAVFDKIIIDTQKPVRSSISINNDAEFATDSLGKVSLTIKSIGAKDMRLANTEADLNSAPWEPYAERKDWYLSKGDGDKSVYIQFKDNSGNFTETVSDNIYFDATAPKEGNLTINEGDEITRQPDGIVQLNISVDEAAMILISNDKDFKGARWRPFESPEMVVTDWRLDALSAGKKTVYVKFRDDAENESAVYSAEITLIK